MMGVFFFKKEDLLKIEALEIASSPLTPSKNASAEMIAIAKEKIKSSIDLIKQDYNYDMPWLDLGSYRKLVGDYSGAISAWKFLMKIRPKDFIAPHNLGELYGFVLADYPQSEKYFLKSIENNKNNIQAYFSLAEIYAVPSFGKTDQIEKILLRGLENNPKDANLEARLNSYRAG
jgi:tetratricopeptide (TPR) repeat protein